MRPLPSPAPSPIRRSSKLRSPAAILTGDVCCRQREMPAWLSIRQRLMCGCRTYSFAAAAWPRHFRKTSSRRNSISPNAPSNSRFGAKARAARGSGPATSPKATLGSMPVTGHDCARRAFLMALAAPLVADTHQEIGDFLGALAAALSEGNGSGFLDRVDHAMPDYYKFEQY